MEFSFFHDPQSGTWRDANKMRLAAAIGSCIVLRACFPVTGSTPFALWEIEDDAVAAPDHVEAAGNGGGHQVDAQVKHAVIHTEIPPPDIGQMCVNRPINGMSSYKLLVL